METRMLVEQKQLNPCENEIHISLINKLQPNIYNNFKDNFMELNIIYKKLLNSYCHSFFKAYYMDNWSENFIINDIPNFLCSVFQIGNSDKYGIKCCGNGNKLLLFEGGMTKGFAIRLFSELQHMNQKTEISKQFLKEIGFTKNE